jgi:hypothetical protein
MGLTFLAPLFFAGLVAVAVPIYVHLIQRERKEAVEFPSLMFLQQIPYRSVRRQRIRHWALLALRCLALVLLATAFARPFFRREANVGGGGLGSAREVVLLLDRSYSMGYADRWARAQAAARGALDGLRPGDRATVVVFDESPEALTEPTTDRGRLQAAVARVTPGSGGTRYAPALRMAQKILAESRRPRREVVLVSDFQRRGWEARDDAQLPTGTTFTPVDVSDGKATADVAVTSATLRRERPGDREFLVAAARVANAGEAAVANHPVTLSLNGRAIETRRVQLPPRSAATVTFARVPLPAGETRGVISAAPDALRPDDVFHFTLSPAQELAVLVLEPPDPHLNQSLYIRRVFELSETPPVRLTVKSAGQLAAGDLADRSLVVLNDVAFPQGDAGRRLTDFVSRGGGLLVVLGEHSTAGAWAAEAGRLLPGRIGQTTDRTAGAGATLVSVEYAHPVFELFNQPRSGDFATARFFRYRALDVRGGARTDTTAILARFDDGGIALAERRVGAGRVLVWTSTLDNFWNDLALQPVFLPFVHQLARYAARFSEAKPWFTVGEALDLGRQSGAADGRGLDAGADLVAQAPSGERTQLGGRTGARSLALREHGFYEVRALGSAAGSGRAIAVNVDAGEADLSHMDPAELTAAVAKHATPASASVVSDATPEEAEQRQTLWWYLLAAAVMLLAAETVLANRLSLRT